jgi:transcriptional regulator with XRE-family HTH domain
VEKQIVQQIAEEIERKGLSQTVVAERARLSQPYVSEVLSGKKVPSHAALQRLLKVCGLTLTATRRR